MQFAELVLDARVLRPRKTSGHPSMVSLRIADIVATLVADDPSLLLAVGGAGTRFVVQDADRPDVTLNVRAADALHEPAGATLFDSGSAWRLYKDGDGFLFSFHSTTLRHTPYRLASFNESFTSGTVVLDREFTGGYPAGVPALQYPLDELLWTNLLARGRGVEIHACGVIDHDGRGCLFPGQSGAGKSTIARPWHLDGTTVVSDDRVIIRMRDGQPWIFGTPWHGDEELASPASAPLKRILFLARGDAHAVRTLRPANAAARLFACSFPPFHDRNALDFTVRLLGDIVTAVPCGELSFVPDRSVVSFVRELTS